MSDERAEYGKGSVKPYKVKGEIVKDKWRICVDFGVNTVTGKRERVTKIVTGSKRKANKERDKLIHERESGIKASSSKVTFAEYADSWLKIRNSQDDIRSRTKYGIKATVNTLKAHLGNITLKKLTKRDIQQAYADIQADVTSKGGKGNDKVRKCHIYLKQILNDAVENDYLVKNPMGSLKPPKAQPAERRSLTKPETDALTKCLDATLADLVSAFDEKENRRETRLAYANGKNADKVRTSAIGMVDMGYVIAVKIGLATGMRLGEVFGLVWENVNTQVCKIHVCQSLGIDGTVSETKTNASKRDITIDGVTAVLLSQWQDMQAGIISTLGYRQTEKTPVCCSNTGGFAGLANFQRWWRKWRTDNGFDDLKFHELRHTQATMLLALGVDTKTVQNRLGHVDASITLNWYAHATQENDERAAAIMGALIYGNQPEETPDLPPSNMGENAPKNEKIFQLGTH